VIQKITVILIERSYLLRSGIEELLKEFQGIYLAEIYDGTEKNLVKKINTLKPDCVIVNPKAITDSLNTFIRSLNNGATVIGLISGNTADHIKSRFANTLHIKDGKHELMNSLSQIIGHKKSKKASDKNQPLTERELTILKHITLGLTNQEVAEKLFLSVHTVMTHRKNITKKLGIKTVSGLTVYALLNKVIDIQDIDQ
jgi:DNA-binding NarL/FixJ family response regulator